MGGYGAAFGRGMIIGMGAALLYAAVRENTAGARVDASPRLGDDRHSPSRLIDWSMAERVALRTAGQEPTLHPSARAQLQREYEQMLAEIEGPLQAYTGSRLTLTTTPVQVMDRPAWIRANMGAFRDLLEPLEEFYREQPSSLLPSFGVQQAARMVLGSELGLLVGYLSRRVLGQYDISLLGKEPIQGGKLYFVEPNIRRVEAGIGVPRDEFRRWIALHEATHAYEFELHPWVREYMNTTLRSYLRLMLDDMRGREGGNVVMTFVGRLAGNLRQGQHVLLAMMSPRQRELMSRLQALMSLAEGYSNHVMNAVGRELLPHFDLIHDRVEHRQKSRSRAEELFLKLTGLSMKMEQYRLGEAFVNRVVAERGVAFVNRAWDAPENLPTEREIAEPDRWIRRLESGAA